MSQPSNTVTKYVRRVNAATGALVTGKVLADFAAAGWHCPAGGSPATYAHGSVIAEIGTSGIYAWTYTLPPTAGHFGVDLQAATGTDIVEHVMVGAELELTDLDALGALVSRPIVTVSGQGTIGQITPISLVAARYAKRRFVFKDEAGALIDMTDGVTYTAYGFSVRGRSDQTLAAAKFDGVSGTPAGFAIVGGSGFIDVTINESCSFFSAITEGANVVDTLELRFELVGDLVAVASETVPLVQSSPLYLLRREKGTG